MAAPAPVLVQSASNSIKKRGPDNHGSTTVKVTLDQPTTPGNLVIVVAFFMGGPQITNRLSDPTFTVLTTGYIHYTQMSAWYKAGAGAMSSLTVTADNYRGMTVRVYEYKGVAQSAALDKVALQTGHDRDPSSSPTQGTLAAAGELVFAVIGNQYSRTRQSGFTGGLARIYETTVPGDECEDWERGRITTHQAISCGTGQQKLTGNLSTQRRWISFVAVFKSGISGPARFTVTKTPANLAGTITNRTAKLTVFGPFKVTATANRTALQALTVSKARIGPFNYQYRLGGWGGLLIGANTPYPIESVTGLEGWAMRTSDTDLPREDGALRGIDLQTARQILFRLSAPSMSGNRTQVETLLLALYNALRPQRDTDAELIFRHPGRDLRSLYYRPTDVVRELNLEEALTGRQAFALRAVDPRHYSAVTRLVNVPIASDDSTTVNVIAAYNLGNANAYPVIRVTGPTTGADVTAVQLYNASVDVSFEVEVLLQARAELLGDMRARVSGTGQSVITLNGQSKYGAWQQPRTPFYLAPDPTVAAGANLLYARTVPIGAPVTCTLEYRDTWSG